MCKRVPASNRTNRIHVDLGMWIVLKIISITENVYLLCALICDEEVCYDKISICMHVFQCQVS